MAYIFWAKGTQCWEKETLHEKIEGTTANWLKEAAKCVHCTHLIVLIVFFIAEIVNKIKK